MTHLSPYITAFEKAAKLYPQKVVFKLPICKEDDRTIQGWRDVTYGQFYEMLDVVARYWLKTLKLPPGSVVALWISGLPFSDVLHIFGVMKAGYIPHLLNSEIQSLEVVRALFKETGAGAVIYTTPSVCVEELSKHLSCYPAVDPEQIPVAERDDAIESDIEPVVHDEDIVVILHTSGSTSGRPKVVRLRRRWLNFNCLKQITPMTQSVVVLPRVGSFCHVGQLVSSLTYFMNNACIVLVPWIDFSADAIIQMYNECGLTMFSQFTPLFSITIRHAQNNAELLTVLQSFPIVTYIGGALSEAEIDWCRTNKITLKTTLAMTEAGRLLVSCEGDPSLLQLKKTDGGSYEMSPIDSDGGDVPLPNQTKTKLPLLELIVRSDSLDCPDSSLCDPVDGHFHTKDLFEEVTPGVYKYRGRLDDIIKMGNARKCDTRYIEDQVYSLCKDIVSTCVVVGSGKPSPALLVEPTISTNDIDEKELIELIGHKLASINEGGYPHERITPDHILLLPPGKLPRTTFKRNVNRAAAEKEFKDQIDALYA